MQNITPHILATLTAASMLLMSTVIEASEPYTHDGLHFRFGIGVVAGWSSLEDEDHKVTFSGPGLLDGVQIGGHPIKNLTLFFEADAFTLFSNEMSSGSAGRDAGANQDTVTYSFLTGAGMGYYFMPAGIYLSGAFGASLNNLVFTDKEIMFNIEDLGVGFSLMVAKEWWVSEEWSAGIVCQFLHTAAPGQRGDYITHTVAGGLLLTVSHS